MLSDEDWKWVQDSVPIVCVDVVSLRRGMTSGGAAEVGLILRDTPHQGRRWCLVGGRVFRNESLADAVNRHVRQTLGPQVRFSIEADAQPLYVSQYFTARSQVGVIDPRQHSVAMNYCLQVQGTARAGGEAFEFRWFDAQRLPGRDQFGFEQDRVLAECLARAGIPFGFAED